MRSMKLTLSAALLAVSATALATPEDGEYSVSMQLTQRTPAGWVVIDQREDKVNSGTTLVSGMEIGSGVEQLLPRRTEAEITVNGTQSLDVRFVYEGLIGQVSFDRKETPMPVSDTAVVKYRGEYALNLPVHATSRDGRFALSITVRNIQPTSVALERP